MRRIGSLTALPENAESFAGFVGGWGTLKLGHLSLGDLCPLTVILDPRFEFLIFLEMNPPRSRIT
jgi:hypothetical protein